MMKFPILKKLVILAFPLCGTLAQATTYYWNGSGAYNTAASWGINTNGTGSSPSNFTGSTNIWIVQSGQSINDVSNAWTVPGTVQLNSGSTFTASASGSIAGITTLTAQAGSTFTYSGTGSTGLRDSVTYGDLNWSYSGASAATPGDIKTSGNLVLGATQDIRVATGTGTSRTWTIGGNLTVNSGQTLSLNNGSNGTVTAAINLSGDLTNSGTLNRTGGGTGATSINFVGTGSSSATWGTVTSGINFNVTIGSGKTVAFADSNLNTGTGTLGVTGTLALGTKNATVGGAVSLLGGSITGSTGTLTGGSFSMQSGSVSANLGGSGTTTFNKTTSGTVTLSGSSTYTGATTVSAGTLLVNGSLGSTATSVSSAATLGGTGTIGGAVTVSSGAFLSPGASIESLGVASLDLGGTLLIEWNTMVSPNIDLLNVTGALNLGGSSAVSFSNLGAGSLDLNTAYVFATYGAGGLTGTFGTVSNLPVGFTLDYNYGGLNQIAVVPEPSTALLTFAVAGIPLLRRNRRRSA